MLDKIRVLRRGAIVGKQAVKEESAAVAAGGSRKTQAMPPQLAK